MLHVFWKVVSKGILGTNCLEKNFGLFKEAFGHLEIGLDS
jgi:hypothetical protein